MILEIDDKQKDLIMLVHEVKVIEQESIEINSIDENKFEFILKILSDMKYDIRDSKYSPKN